jgi:hypothetical protein
VRYCEGLPEVGTRPLGAGERAAVARLRRRLRARLALRLALVPASPAAAVALGFAALVLAEGALPARLAEDVAAAISIAAFAAGFVVGPAAALLSARDRWRELREVRVDDARAVAIDFAGGSRALSVLPASERVLARDGTPGGLRERAEIAVAAAAPAGTPVYALPAGGEAGEIVAHGLVRRALSAEERDEIRAHVRKLRRLPVSLWVALAWWALGAVQALRGAARGRPLLAFLTLVLAAGLWRLVRARSLAGRLQADAEEGWAVRATSGAAAGQEGLPVSRLAWTAKGSPAAWRVDRGP